MRPAEVLGIEVPQYVGGGHQLLVPRVVGRTRRAVNTKAPNTPWARDSFTAAVSAEFGDDLVGFYDTLFDHAAARGVKQNFGTGASPGVSSWYRLRGGAPRPLWYASAGTAMKNPKPTFSIYCATVREALGPDEFTSWIHQLGDTSPAFAAALAGKDDLSAIGEVPVDARTLLELAGQILALLDAAIDEPAPPPAG